MKELSLLLLLLLLPHHHHLLRLLLVLLRGCRITTDIKYLAEKRRY
jgi:hypothetical protein